MLGLARFIAAHARRIADRLDPPTPIPARGPVWQPADDTLLHTGRPLGVCPSGKPHREVLDERGIRDLVREEFAAHRNKIADEVKEAP